MSIFFELTIIIVLATIIGLLAKVLKQPLIIGYIVTGILVGPTFLNFINSHDVVDLFSKIGIIILLFIVGLSLNPDIIKDVGKIALITGIGQVISTTIIGYFLAKALGLDHLSALYTAIALTFSSTIIVLKLLQDKGDLDRLYGRIAVGFLIIQDIIATVILMIVSSFTSDANTTLFVLNLFKGVVLLLGIGLAGQLITPKITRFIAKSQELLFLFSLSWGLGLASLFHYLGFSAEIGALVAGVSLAKTPYASEMSSRLKPLRDFFIILFFIFLGTQISLESLNSLLIPGIILSLFVLIGNPLIFFILMNFSGYNKRVSFDAGITIAQISEFSLILATLGFTLGHLSKDILSLITFVGLITIAGSSYLIMYSKRLYSIFQPLLSFLELRKNHHQSTQGHKSHDLILFGYDRVGDYFVEAFKKLKSSYLVVDYNPSTTEELNQNKIDNLFGDAADAEFLKELNLEKARLIVSTIPDYETNSFLLAFVRHLSSKVVIIVTAKTKEEALRYYQQKASYVLMPHHLGSHLGSKMITEIGLEHHLYKKQRIGHLHELKHSQ